MFFSSVNYIIYHLLHAGRVLGFLQGLTLFLCILNFLFCVGVELINSVVMVSGEQRMDSAIHIHIHSPSLSHPGCHVTLSRVPCAIQ